MGWDSVKTDRVTNDDLFAAYIDSLFDSEPESVGMNRFNTPRGDRLKGVDRIVYEMLKSKIEQIAIGSIHETEFRFAVKDIVGADSVTYTSVDLGMGDDKAVARLSGNTYYFESGVEDKIDSMLGIGSTKKCIDSLLCDLPYELYWFDKAAGYRCESGSYSWLVSEDYKRVTIDVSSMEMTIKMAVSKDYMDGTDKYKTRSDLSIVESALNNANEIASGATGTPYDKMLFFKNRICEMVSYNHTAADNKATPYGDPWQLIWAFDNDNTTNIVCEGYSKAFKYLCNWSGIDCDIVTGQMNSGTKTEAHMWNLVTIDNKRYMVDVTNCDEDSIGYPDLLFLRKPTTNNKERGYIYGLYGQNTSYTYDSETTLLYDKEELIISDHTLTGPKYTVSFVANGGGEIIPDIPYVSGSFTLPNCIYIAPAGKVFDKWSVRVGSGTPFYAAEGEKIQVNADTVVTAIWRNAPAEDHNNSDDRITGNPSSDTENNRGSDDPKPNDNNENNYERDRDSDDDNDFAIRNSTFGTWIVYHILSDDTVMITGVDPDSTEPRGHLKLPKSVRHDGMVYKVIGIGDDAFENCRKITKITIGSNIQTIGESAFNGCKNVKIIQVKSYRLTTVGVRAFQNLARKGKVVVGSNDLIEEYKAMFTDAGLSARYAYKTKK